MPYEIALAKRAQKSYDKVDATLRKRLDACFENLEEDPFNHPSIAPLSGNYEGRYRYRLGNWRVIYRVDEAGRVVIVLIIAPRGDAY